MDFSTIEPDFDFARVFESDDVVNFDDFCPETFSDLRVKDKFRLSRRLEAAERQALRENGLSTVKYADTWYTAPVSPSVGRKHQVRVYQAETSARLAQTYESTRHACRALGLCQETVRRCRMRALMQDNKTHVLFNKSDQTFYCVVAVE